MTTPLAIADNYQYFVADRQSDEALQRELPAIRSAANIAGQAGRIHFALACE